jgi:uncharacterized membrane protein
MSNQPPYGGYQGGGYPPPSAPGGKTKTLGLDYSVAGLLAYLPICCINVICSIIWLASEPRENKVLRFHAMQSLLLVAVAIIVGIVFWILGLALAVGTPDAGGAVGAGGGILLFLVQLVISGVLLILDIVAMIKAYQGQIWKIPVIGDIADKNT